MKSRIVLSICVLAAGVFVYSCGEGSAQQPATGGDGATLYSNNCVVCHGQDGKAGMTGATDLSTSVLSHEAAIDVVIHGRNGMRAFSELSKDDIEAVVKHIETLRKK